MHGILVTTETCLWPAQPGYGCPSPAIFCTLPSKEAQAQVNMAAQVQGLLDKMDLSAHGCKVKTSVSELSVTQLSGSACHSRSACPDQAKQKRKPSELQMSEGHEPLYRMAVLASFMST